MIKLIKSLYESKVAAYKNATVQLDAESRIMQEASNVVTDRPDKEGWIRLNQVKDSEKGLLQTTQLEMIRKAREFTRFDPNAKAAISTLVNYIMGRGLTITPKSDDPMVWYIWRDFWTSPRNRMTLKQFEVVMRSLRDGELFIEYFDEDNEGKNTGKTTIRFTDPLLVRAADDSKSVDPTQSINNGVNTDPEDTEKVVSYTVQLKADQNKYRTVPAEKMLHIKVNVDSDQKRGETQLLSIMQMLRHYEQWIENRIILNKMRSAIVLVRSVEGSRPPAIPPTNPRSKTSAAARS
jgi:capsid protein